MHNFIYCNYGEWRAYSLRPQYYKDIESEFYMDYSKVPDYRIHILENGRFSIEKSCEELIGNATDTFDTFDRARDWVRNKDFGITF